jgi:cytosol alanyl aminopeptidase
MLRLLPLTLAASMSFAALPPPPAFVLPNDMTPKKYEIDLTIDPAQDTFVGTMRVDVALNVATNIFWVNGKDLVPLSATVKFAGRTVGATAEAAGGEFIGLEIPTPIGPGSATISIRYQGRLDDKSVVGPYRRKIGADWYVFTTFTPIDARRAFPCFDEPRFKTPWEITIHLRRELKAFSNGREASEILEPEGMKAVHFAETAPLPAEVVAFAVGPFDVFEGAAAGHGTPIRVITTRGLGAQSRAAAQATVDVLPRLEAYTGVPYAFGKLDHVALPEGAYGAVENPGLITYRQTALLALPGELTPEKKRAIESIEAHEMAHQWFGDLVTQSTWRDVWLSEGFATWLSAKVMDEEQPAARKRLSAAAARERIMMNETGPRARPVRLAMNSRQDMQDVMRGVYSRVVYDKGASVLLMLDGWLGEDKVRDGLRAYLKQHAFAGVSTEDLEAALREAAGVDPAPVMDSFLNQIGVPVVRAECKDGKVTAEHTGAGLVPVCVRGDGADHTCGVIDAQHASIELRGDLKRATCPAWIELNSGGTGYYRTRWSTAQLQALLAQGLARLSAAERLTLVYDLRAMESSTEGSALLKRLAGDSEPEIAKAAGDGLKAN